ncbi:HemK family methyltransferase [Pseudomassariella vexata]|uniref:HemK family methyltransferase n=1 Tax=Pseudomassariella vexata TaxID=1141098 RepID=A0A1Y2ELJ5_9PEZI|nr:HemK family methyltransferase [Pseudomassariella vexata]ORY71725.1 HemK family methyltransferase [Pseudomassariella vexata]
MPRLPPTLIRRAHSISPHLATLLPVCRDIASARNELRWIREHVSVLSSSPERLIGKLCRRRGKGAPLQYVLGSQPFGNRVIKCRPGVLIPRPETEAYVVHLAGLIRKQRILGGSAVGGDQTQLLRIVDFCTGSGCIALLLDSLLRPRFPELRVYGFDISERAVALARENLWGDAQRGSLPNANLEQGVVFEKADIFSDDWLSHLSETRNGQGGRVLIDVLISNPPYISIAGFNHSTGRSVRNHEPKLALVPDGKVGASVAASGCAPEDVFYARLFEIVEVVRPRVILMEVGDLEQALRVAEMASGAVESSAQGVIEIWRDWPDMTPEDDEVTEVDMRGTKVPIRGSGNGRSVLVRCRA